MNLTIILPVSSDQLLEYSLVHEDVTRILIDEDLYAQNRKWIFESRKNIDFKVTLDHRPVLLERRQALGLIDTLQLSLSFIFENFDHSRHRACDDHEFLDGFYAWRTIIGRKERVIVGTDFLLQAVDRVNV